MNQAFRRSFLFNESNQLSDLTRLGFVFPQLLFSTAGSGLIVEKYLVLLDDLDIWLYALRDFAPNLEEMSPFERALSNYRELILSEVIRRRWATTAEGYRVPRKLTPFIECPAEVTNTLINLIIEIMSRDSCGYIHPAFLFREVFLENEAIGVMATTEDETGKKLYLKQYRSISQALFEYRDNLFSSPCTRHFFNVALKIAQRPDHYNFDLNIWRDYVKARRRQTTLLEQQADLLHRNALGGVNVARQGRKKNKS